MLLDNTKIYCYAKRDKIVTKEVTCVKRQGTSFFCADRRHKRKGGAVLSKTKQVMSYMLCLVCLFFSIALTAYMFPVHIMEEDHNQVLTISTKCWRKLQPGDLVINEKGQVVGVTDEMKLPLSETFVNVVSKKHATERVLFTTAEGIL